MSQDQKNKKTQLKNFCQCSNGWIFIYLVNFSPLLEVQQLKTSCPPANFPEWVFCFVVFFFVLVSDGVVCLAAHPGDGAAVGQPGDRNGLREPGSHTEHHPAEGPAAERPAQHLQGALQDHRCQLYSINTMQTHTKLDYYYFSLIVFN